MRTAIVFILMQGAVLSWASSTKGEWIAMRVGDARPWKQLALGLLTDLRFVDSFGPDSRFALFREKNGKAPGKIRGIRWQKNLTYRAKGDPDFSKSWGLENTGQICGTSAPGKPGSDIGGAGVWKNMAPQTSTVIAVLDSGLDFSHEEFVGMTWKNPKEIAGNRSDDDGNGFSDDTEGWDFISDNASPKDDNGHGTRVAGILAARGDNTKGSRGVFNGKIMIVKMLDNFASGTTESAIRAIEYAVKNGAKIINASWGGNVYDPALYEAVKWAGQQGVLFVAAAGNEGKNNDTDEMKNYPSSYRLPNIVSVAAYDNQDEIASFSNYGPETVDIGAPGVDIYSPTLQGYGFAEGTSFAAPFVSGIAGLVWDKFPNLTLGAVRERLLKSSVPLHYYERYRTRSAGRVHAGNALSGLEPSRPEVPKDWTGYQTLLATSHPYPVNYKETLVVTHKGASHLRVHFKRFELENKYDTVTIRDGNGRSVQSYSGVLGEFTSGDVLGDTLKIEFLSDYAAVHWGFEIDRYEAVLSR